VGGKPLSLGSYTVECEHIYVIPLRVEKDITGKRRKKRKRKKEESLIEK
jgi:hypothetical protein